MYMGVLGILGGGGQAVFLTTGPSCQPGTFYFVGTWKHFSNAKIRSVAKIKAAVAPFLITKSKWPLDLL